MFVIVIRPYFCWIFFRNLWVTGFPFLLDCWCTSRNFALKENDYDDNHDNDNDEDNDNDYDNDDDYDNGNDNDKDFIYDTGILESPKE